MANNYQEGATIVPAAYLAEGAAQEAVEIVKNLQRILDSGDCPDGFDLCSGDLEVEALSDGALYISSGDESFCSESFAHLVERLAESNLILKSFGLQIAYTCSKRRPDQFGGVCFRAYPCGKVLAMDTQLDDLTDEQFEQIHRIRYAL